MDPRILGIVRHYLDHDWKPGLIAKLINSRFDTPISSKCVRNIRDNKACSAKCAEACPLRHADRWYTPSFDITEN